MSKKTTWVAYGVTGVIGLGVLAGAATAAASAMDLRSADGTTIPGGQLTGKNGSLLERPTVQLRVDGQSVTVVSAPSPTPIGADDTTPDAAQPSVVTPVTPPSAATPATPATPVSPATPASPSTPVTPASVVSAASN